MRLNDDALMDAFKRRPDVDACVAGVSRCLQRYDKVEWSKQRHPVRQVHEPLGRSPLASLFHMFNWEIDVVSQQHVMYVCPFDRVVPCRLRI